MNGAIAIRAHSMGGIVPTVLTLPSAPSILLGWRSRRAYRIGAGYDRGFLGNYVSRRSIGP